MVCCMKNSQILQASLIKDANARMRDLWARASSMAQSTNPQVAEQGRQLMDQVRSAIPEGRTLQTGRTPLGVGAEGFVYPSLTRAGGAPAVDTATKVVNSLDVPAAVNLKQRRRTDLLRHFVGGNPNKINPRARRQLEEAGLGFYLNQNRFDDNFRNNLEGSRRSHRFFKTNPDISPQAFGQTPRGYTVERLTEYDPSLRFHRQGARGLRRAVTSRAYPGNYDTLRGLNFRGADNLPYILSDVVIPNQTAEAHNVMMSTRAGRAVISDPMIRPAKNIMGNTYSKVPTSWLNPSSYMKLEVDYPEWGQLLRRKNNNRWTNTQAGAAPNPQRMRGPLNLHSGVFPDTSSISTPRVRNPAPLNQTFRPQLNTGVVRQTPLNFAGGSSSVASAARPLRARALSAVRRGAPKARRLMRLARR